LYELGPIVVIGEDEPDVPNGVRLLPIQHHAAYPWWSAPTSAILEVMDVAGKTVIDFGCGASAILAIAAARLGASRVVAVEIQPELAEIARLNIAANRLDIPVLPAIEGEADYMVANLGEADYMVANLGDATLVGQASVYAGHGIGTDKAGELVRW